MVEQGLSFCIPVFGTGKFVTDLVESIVKQTALTDKDRGIPYEILLGCDGDNVALPVLKDIKSKYPDVRLFNDPVNRGKFITENTLAQKSKYSNIVFVDSDDKLINPSVIEILVDKYVGISDIVAFAFKNKVDCSIPSLKALDGKEEYVSGGNFMVKRDVFMAMNGFPPWRCRADGPFHTRAGRLNYSVVITEEPFILRLIREGSLLHSVEYGGTSAKRKEYKREHSKDLEEGRYIRQELVTNPNLIEL